VSAECYPDTMDKPRHFRVLPQRTDLLVGLALTAVVVWLSASYVLPRASWLHWLIVWHMFAVMGYVLHPWVPRFLQRRRERRREAAGGSVS